jgi:hypothetical protein
MRETSDPLVRVAELLVEFLEMEVELSRRRQHRHEEMAAALRSGLSDQEPVSEDKE